jgi:hypothetical protein
MCSGASHCRASAHRKFTAKSKRKMGTKNWKTEKCKCGHLPLLKESRENDSEEFRPYLHIDSEAFAHLLRTA